MSQAAKLLETVYSPEAQIDEAAGVVRQVKVLGRDSENGRTYSQQAMQDAARLYEGVEVNIDHDRKDPKRERGLLEGFGVLRNVKESADAVHADLHYLKSHPAAPVFLERAKRFPQNIGLSHNADGKVGRSGGKLIVESVAKVNSVDVVRNPATNKGLFESREIPASKPLAEILEAKYPETAKTCGLLEMAGMGAVSVDYPAEGDSEGQMKAAFRAMVTSAFDDESLDIKATAKRITAILRAYDKLTGSSSEGGSEPDPKDDKSMSESKDKKPEGAADPRLDKLIESVEELKKSNALRDKREKVVALLDEFKVEHDSALIESMLKLPDEASMKALAEREGKLRPAVATSGRGPKPLIESRASQEKPLEYPKDSKSFAAALR